MTKMTLNKAETMFLFPLVRSCCVDMEMGMKTLVLLLLLFIVATTSFTLYQQMQKWVKNKMLRVCFHFSGVSCGK